MISMEHLIKNPDLYSDELKKRFKDVTLVERIVNLHIELKPLQAQLELLRAKKNQFNNIVITLSGAQKQEKISEMREVSNNIQSLEEQTKIINSQIEDLLYQVPNLTWSGIPVGPNSDSNIETAVHGAKPVYDFQPKNYYELPVFIRDYDNKRGVEASGFRGYYIQGQLALLQKALFDWSLGRLIEKGFNYIIPPVFVQDEVMYGTGFFPAGVEDAYEIKVGDRSFWLPGTSEAALMFYHSNQVLDLSIPVKLAAHTRCFRKEAGAYGKDTKGGIRVTQFEKIETVFICRPEDSYKVFDEMTSIFRETLDLLGLYYHDLETSSGDNSNKNHRMIDIEAWFPAQETFRELASSSNCTDYQTRTLNIKTNLDNGEKVFAHSLNCTGITNRTMFAIMEQFQQSDGRVKIPEVLVKAFGKEYLE